LWDTTINNPESFSRCIEQFHGIVQCIIIKKKKKIMASTALLKKIRASDPNRAWEQQLRYCRAIQNHFFVAAAVITAAKVEY